MSSIKISELNVGEALPERSYTATNVSLFLYNAAIWNPHRIHYDEPYTTAVEKHPGVVIDGPLQGDWLNQVVVNWMGIAQPSQVSIIPTGVPLILAKRLLRAAPYPPLIKTRVLWI